MLSILNTLPVVRTLSLRLAALAEDRKGVTALEYGVIASAIVIAIVAIVFTLGSTVKGVFSTVNASM